MVNEFQETSTHVRSSISHYAILTEELYKGRTYCGCGEFYIRICSACEIIRGCVEREYAWN